MKKLIFIFLLSLSYVGFAQGNCLLYPEGSNERKACRLGEKVIKLRQGSRESQELFDSIIKLNPRYDWAYMEKSVPYFKRGFILKGLELLNKAVELNPERHLTYRAYWYFQNRNYKKCIADLEHYYKLPNAYYNELTPGGDMNMKLLLGMAYAKEGNLLKGIATVEECIKSYKSEVDFGLLDYHVLGMLYFKNKQYKKAVIALEKQFAFTSDYADSYYYLGQAYKELSKFKKSKELFKQALMVFKNPYRIRNGYLCFRVYKSDVEIEL